MQSAIVACKNWIELVHIEPLIDLIGQTFFVSACTFRTSCYHCRVTAPCIVGCIQDVRDVETGGQFAWVISRYCHDILKHIMPQAVVLSRVNGIVSRVHIHRFSYLHGWGTFVCVGGRSLCFIDFKRVQGVHIVLTYYVVDSSATLWSFRGSRFESS